MKIITKIKTSTGCKASLAELEALFSDDALILARLEDLVQHGHARYAQGEYILQPKGALIVQMIKQYRRLLGREMGG